MFFICIVYIFCIIRCRRDASGIMFRRQHFSSSPYCACLFLSHGAITNRQSSNIEYSIVIKIRISGYQIIWKRTALYEYMISPDNRRLPSLFFVMMAAMHILCVQYALQDHPSKLRAQFNGAAWHNSALTITIFCKQHVTGLVRNVCATCLSRQ